VSREAPEVAVEDEPDLAQGSGADARERRDGIAA